MKGVLFSLLLLIMIKFSYSAKKVTDLKEFREHMEQIASSPYSRQRIKYIYFELNKEKIGNVQYFSSLLEDFLLTINIIGTVYNIEDKVFIAFVPTETKVDTNFLMDHFEGAFSNIFIRFPG